MEATSGEDENEASIHTDGGQFRLFVDQEQQRESELRRREMALQIVGGEINNTR